MRTIIIILFLLELYSIALAQPKYYERTLGQGLSQSAGWVLFNSDTSMVLGCGVHTTIDDPEKAFTIFCDQYAEPTATLVYGEGFGEFVLQNMISTPFGYALSGWSTDTPDSPYSHAFLMELDHSGQLLNFYDLRDEPYESDIMSILYYPETNTYYLGGFAFTTLPTKRLLIKLTAGVVVWRKYYTQGYDNYNMLLDLLPSPDGGCYAAGVVNSASWEQTGDYLLMKINPAGTIVWDTTYNLGMQDVCEDILRASNGDFVMAGLISHDFANLLRIDSTGQVVWDRDYFTQFERSLIKQVKQVGDDFVAAGSVYAGDYVEGYLMKVRGSDGEPLWVRYFDEGAVNDYFYNLALAPDGGFVCVGRSEPAGSGAYVYVVRTNCMGLLTEPTAAFTYQTTAGGTMVELFNQSLYAYPDSIDGGHYIWDFGDGSPPYICGQGYEPCPDVVTHNYATAQAQYTITLTAVVCSDTSAVTALVVPGSGAGGQSVGVQVAESGVFGVRVYPNPASETLTIHYNSSSNTQAAQWILYDMSGHILQTLPFVGSRQAVIDISSLPEGLYYFTLSQNDAVLQRGKLVFVR